MRTGFLRAADALQVLSEVVHRRLPVVRADADETVGSKDGGSADGRSAQQRCGLMWITGVYVLADIAQEGPAEDLAIRRRNMSIGMVVRRGRRQLLQVRQGGHAGKCGKVGACRGVEPRRV